MIENENPRTVPLAPPPGGRGRGGCGSQRSTIGGEVYHTTNAGRTWTEMTADDCDVSPKGAYYFSQIGVDPANANEIVVTPGRTASLAGIADRERDDARSRDSGKEETDVPMAIRFGRVLVPIAGAGFGADMVERVTDIFGAKNAEYVLLHAAL